MKVSIIVPFAATNHENHQMGHLWNFSETNYDNIVLTTIEVIRNINKVLCNTNKEIILVDNTHNFPEIYLPNLKIVKGWQGYDIETLQKLPNFEKYNINILNNSTMWASMAYNIGIEHAEGDYIICQHNDLFYHMDYIEEMIEYMKLTKSKYISADFKKLFISGYVMNQKEIDSIFYNLTKKMEFEPMDGGYIKTQKFGVADCYFFLCKRDFFDDYYVDWGYGDTNHGATIKCLKNGDSFYHLPPYYDNPNFDTTFDYRTYKWNNKDFCTHLKGGFSEFKMSKSKIYSGDNSATFDEFFNKMINV
tara:strand:+ start:3894 stop:4808 length:915 start_codon:yes stop_codon:yes gene_type:complete